MVKPSSHVALRRKIGLNWVIRSANAHWATPPFSERCSSLLKRVRFGYGSLINLFSTTLSIQANSWVQSLTVSAKRKPVHSLHRDVTTKSERVIAHVIGSNLLCLRPIAVVPPNRKSREFICKMTSCGSTKWPSAASVCMP